MFVSRFIYRNVVWLLTRHNQNVYHTLLLTRTVGGLTCCFLKVKILYFYRRFCSEPNTRVVSVLNTCQCELIYGLFYKIHFICRFHFSKRQSCYGFLNSSENLTTKHIPRCLQHWMILRFVCDNYGSFRFY